MACHPNNTLLIRSNYGDESIAIIQYLFEHPEHIQKFSSILVVYIDTGWASATWPQRVSFAEKWVQQCGFEAITLVAPEDFASLVKERKNFPSAKFQWCAGFLKGLPLIHYLDQHDLNNEWIIALPKRQACYRNTLPEYISECEYHGERKVWHPILNLSDEERNELIQRAGWAVLDHKSAECDPCINSHRLDLERLSQSDRDKMLLLEQAIQKPMFPVVKAPSEQRGNFSMGCGDPFGCGL